MSADIKYGGIEENNPTNGDLFTTHWLLLVICGVTVYIGRRYFTTGLTLGKSIGGISHAVSRRRRILRDPAARRPPPILTYVRYNDACTRSTVDHARKTHAGLIEEDLGGDVGMPGGNRRIPKSTRSPQNVSPTTTTTTNSSISANSTANATVTNTPATATTTSATNDINFKYSTTIGNGTGPGNNNVPNLEMPVAPKHIPFPNIPTDGDLLFEVIMFVFITTAAGLQFLHIYRSVWWLPNSYTRYAMNFYLIDVHLVLFILVLFARRLIYMFGCMLLERFAPVKFQPFVYEFYRIFLLIAIFTELAYCGYNIVQNHSLVNIFYLCYPISVYLILFGVTISPFFELVGWSETSGFGGRPLHNCTSNATAIRTEVENLKTDFNNRMKQVLFNSVLNAYYAGFVPCCFAQSFVYYDVYGCTLHLIFVGIGCFTMYASHILPMRYCDVLHRSAIHLGAWARVEARSHVPVSYNWTSETLWPSGSLVRLSRELYRAQGAYNAAEPGNATHARFHSMFKNPSLAASGLLGLQSILVLVQLWLLICSSQWQQIISLTLLLFVNYYTLFKLGRDYLVAYKVYKAEQTIHEKYMFQ